MYRICPISLLLLPQANTAEPEFLGSTVQDGTSIRHPKIEHEDIGRKLIIKLARFLAVSGFSDDFYVLLRFENGSQSLPNDRVIISQENTYLLCYRIS
jgi:hypothetical protein